MADRTVRSSHQVRLKRSGGLSSAEFYDEKKQPHHFFEDELACLELLLVRINWIWILPVAGIIGWHWNTTVSGVTI
jgi:hypothetical protein